MTNRKPGQWYVAYLMGFGFEYLLRIVLVPLFFVLFCFGRILCGMFGHDYIYPEGRCWRCLKTVRLEQKK